MKKVLVEKCKSGNINSETRMYRNIIPHECDMGNVGLDIADRPHSRIQVHDVDGRFVASHKLPSGALLCGISYLEYQERWYAVIGCLDDPEEDRPAPIYIIDAETYELLSTIRPKEDLGIELAQHLHNVVLHIQDDQLYLVCQAWDPGHYFVLQNI